MTDCDYKRTEIEIREMMQAIRNGKNSIYQVAVRCVKLLNNSADYAKMPYSVDSCFKYIATNIKNLNSFPIWRDTTEKERLTIIRIQKLKSDLNKFVPSKQIHFQSMGTAQKISRRTIEKSVDNKQTEYLLSLNSVLDVSGAIKNKMTLGKEKKQRKGIPRLVWCGWKYGFHWSSNGGPNKKTKKQ